MLNSRRVFVEEDFCHLVDDDHMEKGFVVCMVMATCVRPVVKETYEDHVVKAICVDRQVTEIDLCVCTLA